MTIWQRISCSILFLMVLAVPVLADNLPVATITLGRDPEPPYCIANPGGTEVIFWDIQHQTTPDYVLYQLMMPDHATIIEQQNYPGSTGLTVNRSWTVPAGYPEGKYWVRVEYHSFEAGDEADAEVTFFICSESGSIITHKYQDTNCNGILDSGDLPLQDWWICIEPTGEPRVCQRTDANGEASWVGIHTGHYRVYEIVQTGWTPVGPDSYDVDVTANGQVVIDFLNYRYEDCFGACCFPDGHCSQVTPEDCAAQGGTFGGLGTVCDPNPCIQPPMACCFPDGHCEFVTEEVCNSLGGIPQGFGTVCDPNPCLQPSEACCFPDGHCEYVTAEVCRAQGGVPQGFGTVCDPNTCPQPPQGACCIGNQGDCQILTQAECEAQGGDYQGDGSTCEPTNPCTVVPTQNTTWGKIKATYR